LKIVVCVKQVPDSAAVVNVQDGKVSWGDAPLVLNPWDEYAVEVALLLQQAHGGEVTALTIASEDEKEALKMAIAMGCQDAIRINDPALSNLDTQATARLLAAAINKIGAVDLVTFGMEAIDSNSGVTAAQTGRVLGYAVLTRVAKIVALDPIARTISVERAIEEGKQVISAKLPAVLSFVKEIAEPRYPSFMGIRKAAKAEVKTWSLADLNLAAPAAAVRWQEVLPPAKREVVTEMLTGGSPQEIAEQLADKLIAEKVV